MSFNINLKQPQKPKIRIKNEPTVNDSIGFDGNALSQKPKEVTNVEFGNTARDKMLQKEIKELKENTDNKFDDISTQIDKITLDNEDLTQRVEKVEDDVEHIDAKIDSKIAVESTARRNADMLLQNNITNEATIRQQEDERLQDAIDHIDLSQVYEAINQEATTRSQDDVALGGRIDTEVTNRTNADTVLGGRIDNEANARSQADTQLQNAINTKTQEITITNQQITNWFINENQDFSNYAYVSNTTIQDLINAKYVNVSFSLSDLEVNNICPIQVVDNTLGILTIYSNDNSLITIPYIYIFK